MTLPAWPVGTPVRVKRDNGTVHVTKTRSEPWVLPSGEAVIQVEGISGCYSLSRITPLAEAPHE